MGSPSSPWRNTGSSVLSESSDLLANECSTPIRSSTPPPHASNSAGHRTTFAQPTPNYTPSCATPKGRRTPQRMTFDSPSASPRLNVDRRTLSPHANLHPTRRPSNASLLRSRSVATPANDAPASMTRSRVMALLAVCLLSIGSHFTMYCLGPIKSKMHREIGSSNAQFSILISALNLNSTWTPLVGGILVARYGTAVSSMATTSAVLVGALIIYVGVIHNALAVMAAGFWIFGLGHTPLMVVQETLLARLSPGGHLGLSLALGLVSGKSASFIASFVSLPLANAGGNRAPFAVALGLCTMSFGANLARLILRCGERQTRDGEEVSPKRIVKWEGVSRLGDVFWVYIFLNLFCGAIWQPFLHLSANIIQIRFHLPESQASMNASVLLAGAILLYPIIGYITDRYGPDTPRTTFQLFLASCLLTLFAYVYLSLPVGLTGTPWPGLIAWALGHGASPLLLVVLVARILPVELVPLGLGMHKALEVSASTSSQTLSGLWLDWAKDTSGEGDTKGSEAAAHGLLVIYAAVNVLQCILTVALWRFERARRHAARRISAEAAEEYEQLPMDESGDEEWDEQDEDENEEETPRPARRAKPDIGPESGLARTDAERARGRVWFRSSLGFIGFVWVLWIVTAVRKL